MTIWYEVTITAQQPVSLGRTGPRGFLTRSHPYLPGSVVRGALARAWITRHGSPDHRFVEVFERQVRYGPALPPQIKQVAQTVVTCKYHREDANHLPRYDLANPPSPLPSPCTSWEPGHGNLTWNGAHEVTSTALDRGTITAAERQLFSRETLPAKTRFTGHLVAQAPVAELTEIDRILVGGRGSVMGESTVTIREISAPTEELTQTLTFLVTQTPTILVDEAGRPSLDPSFALSLAGVDPEQAQWSGWIPNGEPFCDLGRQVRAQVEGMGGWHIASGLPKPGEVAVAPGLVIRLEDPADARRLLEHGLGLRRPEGFGWLAPYQPQDPKQQTQDSEPAPQSQPRPFSPARQWLEKLYGLQLTPQQTQQTAWLADQLRTVPAGDPDRAQQVMTEPAADQFTQGQRCQVKKLLVGVPRDLRAPLASRLDTTYGHQGGQR